MATATTDRAYASFLAHLQQPRTSIPLETVFAAIPHYLAHLPLPNPTQLTAFVISSPLWKPLSFRSHNYLIESYRTAGHVKHGILQKEAQGWFSPSHQTLLAQWTNAIMKGTSGGDPQIKIAILGGLLVGLNDLPEEFVALWSKERIERSLVIASAETMDAISGTHTEWKSEFEFKKVHVSTVSEESLFLFSLCILSPVISDEKFSVLDVKSLTAIVERGLESAFSSGQFLSMLSRSTIEGVNSNISIPPDSPIQEFLHTFINNPLYQNVGSLAKLLARCICAVADQSSFEAWATFRSVSERLRAITSRVEIDWNASILSQTTNEEDIELKSRSITTEIWKALKTLLFTDVMVSQAILTSIRYIRPSSYPNDPELRPSSLARTLLRSLYDLSFVISQFGGVVSTGTGFKELKRAFYMAIDIIDADLDSEATDTFATSLISCVEESPLPVSHPSRQAQTAFTLATLEQLVSVLSDSVIENAVVPFCDPFLDDPSHREVYESAHSVMLSIFAAHAQRDDSESGRTAGLAEKLVPFYTESLIKNSKENRLDISQLRLAYSSLVRSASSSGDPALTWLCIDSLLSHIKATETSSRMPLYLTLVSLIPCVPGVLLTRVLAEVEKAYASTDAEGKQELGDAIVQELMIKVGEDQKAFVLGWWYRIVMGADEKDPQIQIE
ncbi:hypothetical protein M422DRAFT_773864 [Sphaerobolus stellatus SS14]|nr:hypothetical protein M422DRAFT_773864 [Sphaerobolus stellatus SS14]